MFDIFRSPHLSDQELISTAAPVAKEIMFTLSKVPDIESWFVIYRRLFLDGFFTGYIYGASERLADKACDEFKVKKDFMYRFQERIRVAKCVIELVFGDSVHAQQHRDMLSKYLPIKQRSDMFLLGARCGIADANEIMTGSERTHNLKNALKLHGYEHLGSSVPLHSLIDLLLTSPPDISQ